MKPLITMLSKIIMNIVDAELEPLEWILPLADLFTDQVDHPRKDPSIALFFLDRSGNMLWRQVCVDDR